jgi:hypothetical protein
VTTPYERLLDELSVTLRGPRRARQRLLDEIGEDLKDAVQAECAAGLGPDAAEALVAARFGSPTAIARLWNRNQALRRRAMQRNMLVLLTALAMAGALAITQYASGKNAEAVSRAAAGTGDPPVFIPWNTVGDIALGGSRARVEREYGSVGHGFHVLRRYGNNVQGYYGLHGSRVILTFYGDRVGELIFSTPYYRTKDGFGVGSKIPLGPCHRTATYRCEHRWHGFVWNEWIREKPCNCWTKVGLGKRSLPLTTTNFEKPWFFIYMRHARVDSFYFALKFVD